LPGDRGTPLLMFTDVTPLDGNHELTDHIHAVFSQGTWYIPNNNINIYKNRRANVLNLQ